MLPDEYIIDDDSIRVTTLFAKRVPLTDRLPSMNAADAVTGPSISMLPVNSILFLITKFVASMIDDEILCDVKRSPFVFT